MLVFDGQEGGQGMKMFGIGLIEWIILLATMTLLAIIPARIAWKKGYSFAGYYVFGFFLFVPAIIVALLIRDKYQDNIDPADEIAKFKALAENGTITQAEFEKKKAELLSR